MSSTISWSSSSSPSLSWLSPSWWSINQDQHQHRGHWTLPNQTFACVQHLAIRLDECNSDICAPSCAPSCAQSLARYKVAIVAQQRHMQLGTHKYPPTPLQRLQNVTNCWKTTRQEVQGLATQISVCFFRPIYQPSTRGPSKFGQVLCSKLTQHWSYYDFWCLSHFGHFSVRIY